jgi:glycerophosphoryl diester phosphodiesterase
MKILIVALLLAQSAPALATLCIAHRGFSGRYFENSLESIRGALDIGAHGVEIDIFHTRDGVAILAHDQTLKKIARSQEKMNCPLDTPISSLTLEQIHNHCELNNGEPIPTLKQAFEIMETSPDTLFFLDLKDQPRADLFNLVAQTSIDHDNIRIITKKRAILKAVEQRKPHLRGLLISKVLPRHRRADGANLHSSGLYLIPYLNWRGNETGVWTVNSPRRMRTAIRRNVDFITTDFPDLCLAMLAD